MEKEKYLNDLIEIRKIMSRSSRFLSLSGLSGVSTGLLAMTLLFYGLALVNGSHYTLSHIRYLGLAEILLGLLALIFIGQSLYIWMLGFGLFQMVYGLLIQRKREEV